MRQRFITPVNVEAQIDIRVEKVRRRKPMSKIYTCEQVSNGHPDKICDQIADAVVTDCLQHDKDAVWRLSVC
jgi:S-adenosylmethionine synthetase